jgi:hypothetical protein
MFLAQDRDQWRHVCEYGNEPPGWMGGGREFLDYLSDCYLFNRDSRAKILVSSNSGNDLEKIDAILKHPCPCFGF